MFIKNMKHLSLVISFILLLPLSLSAGKLPISADLIGTWKIMDVSYVKLVKLFNKDYADSLLNVSADYAKDHIGAIVVFKLDSTFSYKLADEDSPTYGHWIMKSEVDLVRPTENSKEMQQYNVQLTMKFDDGSKLQGGFNGDVKSFNHKKQNFIFFDGRYQILFKRIK